MLTYNRCLVLKAFLISPSTVLWYGYSINTNITLYKITRINSTTINKINNT